MENYYEFIKNKSIGYSFFVYSVIFIILLNLFMNFLGYEWLANYKSRSVGNIKVGCAYYGGEYKTKYNNGVFIQLNGGYLGRDGRKFYSNKFPFNFKQKKFYQDVDENKEGCHKVKYIELNFYVFKKIFIYDYINLENNRG